MYDRKSLTYLLRMAGFKDISQKRLGESVIEDVANLDRPERFQASVCLEAIK